MRTNECESGVLAFTLITPLYKPVAKGCFKTLSDIMFLMQAITEKDGNGLAHKILQFSDDQRCKVRIFLQGIITHCTDQCKERHITKEFMFKSFFPLHLPSICSLQASLFFQTYYWFKFSCLLQF